MKYANSQMAMDLLSGFFVFFPLSPRRVLLVLTMNNSAGVIRKRTCLPFGTPVVKEFVLLVSLHVSVVCLLRFMYCTLYCTCIWIVHFLFQFCFFCSVYIFKAHYQYCVFDSHQAVFKTKDGCHGIIFDKMILLKTKIALIWLHIDIIRALLKMKLIVVKYLVCRI
jgi:hypothetical protein